MVDFITAIKKPFTDLKALGIGTVLSCIPIISLFVSGYALKVAEDTMGKKNKLRAWALNDAVDYLVKAILSMIIGLAYMIIPIVLIVAGVGGALASALMTPGGFDVSQLGQTLMNALIVGAPLILAGALLMIIALIMLPMAMMKWIKSGSIMSAFNVIAVIKNVLTVDYILSLIVLFVYAIVFSIVIGIISMIAGFIPIVGFLVIMLLNGLMSFAMMITVYTTIAQTVKN